jgi:hypothetical protein
MTSSQNSIGNPNRKGLGIVYYEKIDYRRMLEGGKNSGHLKTPQADWTRS